MCDTIVVAGTDIKIKTVGDFVDYFQISPEDYMLIDFFDSEKSRHSCLCAINLQAFFKEWPEHNAKLIETDRWEISLPSAVDHAMCFRSHAYKGRSLSKTYVEHHADGCVFVRQVLLTRWPALAKGYELVRFITYGKLAGWCLYYKDMGFTSDSILTIFNFILPLENKRLVSEVKIVSDLASIIKSAENE